MHLPGLGIDALGHPLRDLSDQLVPPAAVAEDLVRLVDGGVALDVGVRAPLPPLAEGDQPRVQRLLQLLHDLRREALPQQVVWTVRHDVPMDAVVRSVVYRSVLCHLCLLG